MASFVGASEGRFFAPILGLVRSLTKASSKRLDKSARIAMTSGGPGLGWRLR